MIIRVQSPNGIKRIELPETDSYDKFLSLVCEKFGIGRNDSWCLSRSHSQSERLNASLNTRLAKLGLKYSLLSLTPIYVLDTGIFSSSWITTEVVAKKLLIKTK